MPRGHFLKGTLQSFPLLYNSNRDSFHYSHNSGEHQGNLEQRFSLTPSAHKQSELLSSHLDEEDKSNQIRALYLVLHDSNAAPRKYSIYSVSLSKHGPKSKGETSGEEISPNLPMRMCNQHNILELGSENETHGAGDCKIFPIRLW